ncbi:MAG: hypothetical protein N2438_01335 [Limisphaera sp.]|nr:hypothetical protein [Limisphaera sp.]
MNLIRGCRGVGKIVLRFRLPRLIVWLGLSGAWPWLGTAYANVYATHIRLFGSLQPDSGGTVEIRYVLNEPATAGVTIEILQGNVPVRVMSLAGGGPGTIRGENTVVWDGRDGFGQPVCCGSYRVRVTAAAHGFETWTQTSDDFNLGNYVYAPTGIAVHRDPTSPFYGRVFVANGRAGPNAEFMEGDRPGILRFHADGSPVEEEAWTDGGWPWAADGTSPGDLEVGANGWLYVWDGAQQLLLRFGPGVSSASRRVAWGPGNSPQAGASMTRFGLSPRSQMVRLWMAQAVTSAGPGVYGWFLDAEGVAAANDPGVLAVVAGAGSDLTVAPADVAEGAGGWLFAVQARTALGDPAPRVLAFFYWTNEPVELREATWTVGAGDDNLRGATAVAVDPMGRYLAVAFRGVFSGGIHRGGRVMIFDAVTGEPVATLPRTDQAYSAVAWDAVGNLYVASLSESVWRVYSPPGGNASSTLSIQTVEVTEPSLRPVLEALRYEAGQLWLALRGRTNTSYVVEGSADLRQWNAVATVNLGSSPRQEFAVPAQQPRQFYRARPGP